MDRVKILVNEMPDKPEQCPFSTPFENRYYCTIQQNKQFCILCFKGHVSNEISLDCEFLATLQGTWCGPAVVKKGKFNTDTNDISEQLYEKYHLI